jgi:coronin-7
VVSPGTVVVDLDYSPFESNSNASVHPLAIGCEDGTIKIFHDGQLRSTLKHGSSDSKKMDNINFHSTTTDILASSSDKVIQVWDIQRESLIRDLEAPDQIQSMSWSFDGTKLSTVSKDNYLRQWDPRQKSQISEGICHTGIKPSKVVDLKEEHYIFTTGFSQKREREYAVWDARNLTRAVKLQCIDSSVGMLSPLYDPDADLMFLLGKGDSVIRWLHVDSTRVIDFPSVSVGSSIMAGTLLPKRSCEVMTGEADRLYIATANGSTIIPVSVIVPRRTYADFHADLFPDTRSSVSNASGTDWESGADIVPELVSLNPAMARPKPVVESVANITSELPKPAQKPDSVSNIVKPLAQVNLTNTDSPKASPKTIPKFGTKTSSYRFIDGKASAFCTDLRDISLNNNNETNGFEVNEKYVAFALAGAGGRIGVWSVSKTGRLPVKIPSIICGSELCDFKWNPFCNDQLVTGRWNTVFHPKQIGTH